MRVLLIHLNPEYASRGGAISLGYLGETLKKEGIEAYLLDFALTPESKLESEIKRIKPDLIGITAVIFTYDFALRIAHKCRQIEPNTKIIMGGPQVSFTPKETLSNKDIDFVCMREGEYTLLELAKALEKGKKDFKDIKGLAWKKGGKIIINKPRPFIQNLDEIPMPHPFIPWKKYPVPLFGHSGTSLGPTAFAITSRGCPNNCAYCISPLMEGNKLRMHSIKRVIDELTYLTKEVGINQIRIADLSLTINKKRAIELCKQIITNKIDITWGTNSHINQIDKEMLYWMKRAGCISIDYGIESGSPKILQRIGRKTDLDLAKKVVALTRKMGLRSLCYFIIGLPGETKETLMETLNFVKNLDAYKLSMTYAIPLPGTKFYEMAKKDGYKITKSQSWNSFSPNISTPDLTNFEMQKLRRRILAQFYLYPPNLLKMIKNMKSPAQLLDIPIFVLDILGLEHARILRLPKLSG